MQVVLYGDNLLVMNVMNSNMQVVLCGDNPLVMNAMNSSMLIIKLSILRSSCGPVTYRVRGRSGKSGRRWSYFPGSGCGDEFL